MKKAIEFLRTKGIKIDDNGNILSTLPVNEAGLTLSIELEEATETEKGCYIIVGTLLTFQEY